MFFLGGSCFYDKKFLDGVVMRFQDIGWGFVSFVVGDNFWDSQFSDRWFC